MSWAVHATGRLRCSPACFQVCTVLPVAIPHAPTSSLTSEYRIPTTLQDPVVTPDGCLYSKESILENLLAQKKAIKRNLEAWEAAQQQQKQKVRVEAGIGGCKG